MTDNSALFSAIMDWLDNDVPLEISKEIGPVCAGKLLDRLTAELARKDSEIESHKTTRRMWQERAEQLIEELARKEEALQAFAAARITDLAGNHAGWRISGKDSVNEAFELARAALAPMEKKNG